MSNPRVSTGGETHADPCLAAESHERDSHPLFVPNNNKLSSYDFPLSLSLIENLESQIAQSQNPSVLRVAINQVYKDNIAATKQALGEEEDEALVP